MDIDYKLFEKLPKTPLEYDVTLKFSENKTKKMIRMNISPNKNAFHLFGYLHPSEIINVHPPVPQKCLGKMIRQTVKNVVHEIRECILENFLKTLRKYSIQLLSKDEIEISEKGILGILDESEILGTFHSPELGEGYLVKILRCYWYSGK